MPEAYDKYRRSFVASVSLTGRDSARRQSAILAKTFSRIRFVGGPAQSGMILGTAAYMSPEQAKGKAVDKRSPLITLFWSKDLLTVLALLTFVLPLQFGREWYGSCQILACELAVY